MLSKNVSLPAQEALASGVVENDKSCVRCGYNLRTLPAQGRCPECGLSVAKSFRTDRLALADNHWRDRVNTGIAICCWAMGLYTFIVGLSEISGRFSHSLELHTFSLALCETLVLFVGGRLLTTPEYGRPEKPGVTLGGVFRLAMIVNVVAWIIYYTMLTKGMEIFEYFRLWAAVTTLLFECLFLLYVRQFSRRVPDFVAVRQWTVLLLVAIIQHLYLGVLPGLEAITNYYPRWSADQTYANVAEVLTYGQSIWTVLLLLRLYKQVRATPTASPTTTHGTGTDVDGMVG